MNKIFKEFTVSADRDSFTKREGELVVIVRMFEDANWGYTLWREGKVLAGECRAEWHKADACTEALAALRRAGEDEEPLTGTPLVESVAQVVEKHFEGKAVRLIRGHRYWKVMGVEYDEQVGCFQLILEGRHPALLFYNEKYVIAEIREEA